MASHRRSDMQDVSIPRCLPPVAVVGLAVAFGAALAACGSPSTAGHPDVSGNAVPTTATSLATEETAQPRTASTLSLDRLAPHVEFRSSFDFLSTDHAHIAALVAAGGDPEALAYLGLELSGSEWAEMERRMRVIERHIEVKRLITGRAFGAAEEAAEGFGGRLPTGPLFAGVWQDHLDGGVLKVAVTDLSAVDLAALYGLFQRGQDDVKVIEQQFSLDQLWVWRDVIADRLQRMQVGAALGFDHSDTGVRIQLSLFGGFHDVDLDDLLAGIPRAEVVVEYAEGAPAFLPGVVGPCGHLDC